MAAAAFVVIIGKIILGCGKLPILSEHQNFLGISESCFVGSIFNFGVLKYLRL
jgi:hypothetical protein